MVEEVVVERVGRSGKLEEDCPLHLGSVSAEEAYQRIVRYGGNKTTSIWLLGLWDYCMDTPFLYSMFGDLGWGALFYR